MAINTLETEEKLMFILLGTVLKCTEWSKGSRLQGSVADHVNGHVGVCAGLSWPSVKVVSTQVLCLVYLIQIPMSLPQKGWLPALDYVCQYLSGRWSCRR